MNLESSILFLGGVTGRDEGKKGNISAQEHMANNPKMLLTHFTLYSVILIAATVKELPAYSRNATEQCVGL